MRSLIAGVDEAGSCIVAEMVIPKRDVDADGISLRTDVFALRETPPPARPLTKSRYHDTGLEPGHVEHMVIEFAACAELPFHCNDSVNFHTVVAGSVELLLDDGPHHMDVGDSLVLPGVDHGWQAGPSGCTMTLVNVGSARP